RPHRRAGVPVGLPARQPRPRRPRRARQGRGPRPRRLRRADLAGAGIDLRLIGSRSPHEREPINPPLTPAILTVADQVRQSYLVSPPTFEGSSMTGPSPAARTRLAVLLTAALTATLLLGALHGTQAGDKKDKGKADVGKKDDKAKKDDKGKKEEKPEPKKEKKIRSKP